MTIGIGMIVAGIIGMVGSIILLICGQKHWKKSKRRILERIGQE